MTDEMAAARDDSSDPTPGVSDVYSVDNDGPDTEQLARELVKLSWDVKAINPVAIDLRGRASYTDFLVVCTGKSDRHVKAIGQRLHRELKQAGWSPVSIEGLDSGRWALLDFGDVVIHVFSEHARGEYDLEGMWVDADQLNFEEKPDELYGHFEVDRFDGE
jgi:ribosome-associated protein